MRKFRGYITRNWFWLAIGCVLTGIGVECAYLERGYMAIGGEWCVLPVILVIVEIYREIYRYLAGKEGQNDTGIK